MPIVPNQKNCYGDSYSVWGGNTSEYIDVTRNILIKCTYTYSTFGLYEQQTVFKVFSVQYSLGFLL